MPLRAVVFDLDGTLVASERDIAAALNHVLESLGRPPHPLDAVRRMIGRGAAQLLRAGLGEGGAHLFGEAHARFRTAYAARLLDTTRPYPGVPEALAQLAARGWVLGVATNKPSVFTQPMLERLGAAAWGIRAVASADEVAERKPDPAVLRLALTRLGLDGAPPGETAYVGDMAIDVETGQRFGCHTLGVTWGFDPAGLRAARPEAVAATPAEMAELLLGL